MASFLLPRPAARGYKTLHAGHRGEARQALAPPRLGRVRGDRPGGADGRAAAAAAPRGRSADAGRSSGLLADRRGRQALRQGRPARPGLDRRLRLHLLLRRLPAAAGQDEEPSGQADPAGAGRQHLAPLDQRRSGARHSREAQGVRRDLRGPPGPLALAHGGPEGGGAHRRSRVPHRHGQGAGGRSRSTPRRLRDHARRAAGAGRSPRTQPRVLRRRRSRPAAARRALAYARGSRMTLADALPSVNATLNATSACSLFLGYWAIRTKRYALHWKCMAVAFTASALFLVGYITRFALTGVHR